MSTGGHSPTDAVCVGETMVLLVPDPPVPPDQAEMFRRDIGGAESNVAIHLARSGRRACWRSALGDDAFGRFVHRRISAEGVDCDVRIDDSRPTGLYVKELGDERTTVQYYRQGSAAAAMGAADTASVWARRPSIVHTTGITATLSESGTELVTELLTGAPAGTLRTFDVNFRQALHDDRSAELLLRLARQADVVFCGLDEAQALWDVTTIDQLRFLLAGPELLLIKRGAEGVSAVRDGTLWHQPAPAVDVVEPVGAGDAFAAGVIDQLLAGADIEACLQRGTRLAGTVLQAHGDLPSDPATTRPHESAGSMQH